MLERISRSLFLKVSKIKRILRPDVETSQFRIRYNCQKKRVGGSQIVACILLIFLLPLLLFVGFCVLIFDGRPVIFRSPRMKRVDQRFDLLKFRTMKAHPAIGVTGGDKENQITPLGRILRRFRFDELPQILNVLFGDIAFVGPRPPAPEAVTARPDIYELILRDRPGITGLATLSFRAHEEMILKSIKCSETVQRTYIRRCIPRKARLDLIYSRRRSLKLDLWLISITALHLIGISPKGRLWRRKKAKPVVPVANVRIHPTVRNTAQKFG